MMEAPTFGNQQMVVLPLNGTFHHQFSVYHNTLELQNELQVSSIS